MRVSGNSDICLFLLCTGVRDMHPASMIHRRKSFMSKLARNQFPSKKQNMSFSLVFHGSLSEWLPVSHTGGSRDDMIAPNEQKPLQISIVKIETSSLKCKKMNPVLSVHIQLHFFFKVEMEMCHRTLFPWVWQVGFGSSGWQRYNYIHGALLTTHSERHLQCCAQELENPLVQEFRNTSTYWQHTSEKRAKYKPSLSITKTIQVVPPPHSHPLGNRCVLFWNQRGNT